MVHTLEWKQGVKQVLEILVLIGPRGRVVSRDPGKMQDREGGGSRILLP